MNYSTLSHFQRTKMNSQSDDGVLMQLNFGIMSTAIVKAVASKQHSEEPVPHYLMERKTFESKKKGKWNKRRIEATDGGFVKKKGRTEYRNENGKESLVTQHKEQRTCVQDALYQSLIARN